MFNGFICFALAIYQQYSFYLGSYIFFILILDTDRFQKLKNILKIRVVIRFLFWCRQLNKIYTLIL